MQNIRNDIQILRAIAVLSVVFYHFNIFSFDGGYLGVDIFFVISGYLVTLMITKGLSRNSFSFIEFYIRRAKRLLPAAYSTFFITLLLSFFILTSKELYDFLNQLIGALTFSANYFLFFQGTYFGGESELKPLLHTWSLSIEEQYYLLLPLILFFLPKRLWLISGSTLLLLSLFSSIYIKEINPSAAFYFFPFRAWELALGSILAITISSFKKINLKLLLLPSYLSIFYILMNPLSPSHPGIDAVLICILTAMIIVCNHSFKENKFIKFGIFTGDISYSLYLVHWPIYSFFMNIWFGDELTYHAGLAMLLVSYILAIAQYKFVETPFRKKEIQASKFNLLRYFMPAMIACFVILIPMSNIKDSDPFYESRMANNGFGYECTFEDMFFANKVCIQGEGKKKKILVWGDSNAMHLVHGVLSSNPDNTVVQATKYVCAPFDGIAPIGKDLNSFQNKKWSESCIKFNNSVKDYISQESFDLVILSTALQQYISPQDFDIVTSDYLFSGTPEEQINITYKALLRTINFLNSKEINHIFVGPPPALSFDLGRCAERKEKKLIMLGKFKDCIIDISEVEKFRLNNYKFYQKLESNPEVNFINLDKVLIKEEKIHYFEKNNIYIENAHLSKSGSEYVSSKIDFNNASLKID